MPQKSTPSVLIVDDNPNNLEILREMLPEGARVFEASDGWTALQLAAEHLPRLVLLDVMLPGLDGCEVCRRMRKILGMQSAKIVMVSAKALPEECKAGLQAGADAYLTKPFGDDDLGNLMRRTQTAS